MMEGIDSQKKSCHSSFRAMNNKGVQINEEERTDPYDWINLVGQKGLILALLEGRQLMNAQKAKD